MAKNKNLKKQNNQQPKQVKKQPKLLDEWKPFHQPKHADRADTMDSVVYNSSQSVFESKNNGDLINLIVQQIQKAKYTIVLCSFLLADNQIESALIQAAEKGVRLYLMISSENIVDSNQLEDEFTQEIKNKHIAFLRKMQGRAMIRTARHFHAKVLLVDAIGETESIPFGLMLTANFTTLSLTRNQELAVILDNDQIKDLVKVFRWAFFEEAEHQIIDGQHFESIKPLNEITHPELPNSSIRFTSSKVTSIKNAAKSLIKKAQTELYVSSFGFEKGYGLVDTLCAKAKAGVKVTIFARGRSFNDHSLKRLREAGATVKGYKWLHAKAIWIDSGESMIMSSNFQKDGLEVGFEVGMIMDQEQSRKLKKLLDGFTLVNHQELRSQAEREANKSKEEGEVQKADQNKKN